MKNSSDYFKLKKIKVTKLEKIIALVLVLIVSFIYFIYPIDIQNVAIFQDSSENVMSILKSFDFPGILQQQTVFSNGYVNVVYFNEGKLDSHLININKRQEVSLNDFLKDDCETKFSQKEEELLLLKFPKKIVELLLADQDKTYIFNDEYLHITYNAKDVIASTRNFDLKIYYKHIANYLEFNVVVDDSAIDENGFAYDPNKISVSFTFDDGPNGKNTQTLISALEDYKMTATFFMVGNKLNNDRQTVKMVADSHSEIGYHSYRHEYFTRQSEAQIKEEFIISDNILYNITGRRFQLTRPPYGAYDQKTLNSIENAFIRWNLDTNDWRYRDVEYIKKYVLDNLSDGSIVLFHDTYKTSIEATLQLLDILYLMDVQVMSITDLAKLKGIDLQNHEVYYDFK